MKLTLKEKLVIQTIFTESSHYLLVEETNVGEKISQMLFSWQRSFPQLFQIPLSKKLFYNSVKYMIYLTANSKSYITISAMANAILELLPIKPSMTYSTKHYLMTLSFFRSCGLRKKYNAKSVFTHAVLLATQLQITLQMRTVSLIMRILHFLLWRVETNESPLRMQHQIQTRLLLQL